jgi:transcriptional regulator GlxA family with amidase domain
MATLEEASAAGAVIVGSGMQTREVVADEALMAQLRLDPSRQLLAAQCSGTLILAKLGLLDGVPACTDLTTKPWVQAAGVDVLNQPFFSKDNVATAGGCLASPYLAAWLIARLEGVEAAESALHHVAPVGEKDEYVARAMRNIGPYLGREVASA